MARAIRSALALTTVALAMSGSGAAFAQVGVCVPAGPTPGSTVNCDGVFNAGNTNVPISYAVEDLTLVIGATDPATTVDTTFTSAVYLTGTTGGETLLNYGDITATEAYSAVNVTTTSGDISVITSGDIAAYNTSYPVATAIYAHSTDGDVYVGVQAGALLQAQNSSGQSFGIDAYSQYGNVTIDNAGDIYTSANYGSYGIHAESEYGIIDATSSGSITANGDAFVYGIYAHGYADIYVDNQGTINSSTTASGFGTAYGIMVYTSDHTGNSVTVDNSGDITAFNSGNGNAYGIYVYAYYGGDVTITHDGSISATTYNGDAYGIYATLVDGDATVSGVGDITVYADGYAEGIYVYVDGDGNASVSNGGAIDVTSGGSYAYGVNAYTNGYGNLYVGTSGSIDVTAYEGAFGIHAYSTQTGAVDVVNSATITVLSYYSSDEGIHAATNGAVSVDNSGDLSVTSYVQNAIGIYATGDVSASVNNDAAITVDAALNGTGIEATSYAGDVTVTGAGTVTVNAGTTATGIYAQADAGNVYVTLTGGSVYAGTTGVGDATGIYASTAYGGGNIAIASDADVSAYTNGGTGTGIYASTHLLGDISITGSGNISATSITGDTYGIYAYGADGDVYVNVSGDITAYGGGDAYGIHVETYGDIDITSSGAIDAMALNAYSNAAGIFVYTCDCDVLGVSVDNNGDITAAAGNNGDAWGIYVYAYGYYATTVYNDGSITATTTGTGDAYGIEIHATDGAVTVGGAGDVTVSADHYAYGVHVYANGDADVTVDVGGTIDVYSTGSYAYGIAVGVDGYGDVYVGSAGDMNVSAYEYAAGIHAYSNYDGAVDVVNGGDMVVTSDYASAVGVFVSTAGGASSVYNDGTIAVTTYFGPAQGINVNAYDIVVGNDGGITVDATGGFGQGIQAISLGGSVDVDSQGSIDVTASGVAQGTYVFGTDGDVTVDTGGTIDASSTGTHAYGVQVTVFGNGNVYVTNGADITVGSSAGGYAGGIDVYVYYGNATVDNSGDISVTSVNGATHGIYVEAGFYGNIDVNNDGNITLSGGGPSLGIYATTSGDVGVTGSGTIDATTTGDDATGIFAHSNLGYVDVDLSGGSVSATSTLYDATGIEAYAYDDVYVHSAASVLADAQGAGGQATGIQAYSYNGDSTVVSGAAITANADSYAYGIHAYTGLGGNVGVTTSGGPIDASSANADAWGVLATTGGAGTVTVDNGADVSAYSGIVTATGIDAQAAGGAVTIDNSGDVDATGYQGAVAIHGYSYGATVDVGNSGALSASTFYGNAAGIEATSYQGDVVVDASGGSITATSTYGYAFGIDADAYGDITLTSAATIDVTGADFAAGIFTTSDGDTTIDSTSVIDVSSTANNSQAYGVYALSTYGGVSVDLSAGSIDVVAIGNQSAAEGVFAIDQYGAGDVSVTSAIDVYAAGYYATGITAFSYSGDASVSSSGDVTAAGSYNAWGLGAQTFYGATYVGNSGTVSAVGASGIAWGIRSYGGTTNTVDNSGDVIASADAYALGIVVRDGFGDIYLYNSGTVSATAYAGQAWGIIAHTYGGGGSVLVDNSGSVTVDSYYGAYGILAYANGYDVSVTGGGIVDVTSAAGIAEGISAHTANANVLVDAGAVTVSGYGDASGIHAYVSYGDGDVTVYSAGIDVYSQTGSASGVTMSVYGDGNLLADVSGPSTVAGYLDATGLDMVVYGFGYLTVTNSGAMDVSSQYALAQGMYLQAQGGGYVDATNTGDIDVYAAHGLATGIHAGATFGYVTVDNSGSVSATSYYSANGIYAAGDYGTTVYNSGSVSAASPYDDATGIHATSAYGDVLVDSSGSVLAYSPGDTIGIQADTGLGNATVYSGTVDAYSTSGNAWGVLVTTTGDGDLYASLSGPTTVTGYLDAIGVKVHAYGDGNAAAANSGTITVSGDYATAQGMLVLADGLGDASATSSGSIDVTATHGLGTGIYVASALGYAFVDNAGSVDVSSYYSALGIGASGFYGATVYNTGSISAASAYYDATGIYAQSQYGDVLVYSTGGVAAYAYGSAYGIHAIASAGGNVTLSSGDVVATSSTGTAVGIAVDATGGGDVAIDSQGVVYAIGYGGATGIYAHSAGALDVVATGPVFASASGDYSANAAGVYLLGYDVYFHNAADVLAYASADPGAGAAYAEGVHVDGTYVDVYLGAGTLVAAAADGYYATAVGLAANGSYGLYLGLEGDIQATAEGDFTWATGVQASSYVDVVAYSNGVITAASNGTGYAYALGVGIESLAGDIFFYNGGAITATAADYAVGVALLGSGATTLINNGLIAAYTAGGYGVALASGDADDLVLNNGTINGAVRTGDGDDLLVIAYGATWNVDSSFDSYFGLGDDGIVNYGTINMSDAIIDLGLPAASGNYVRNYGLITVSGDNIIDLEGGSAARVMDAALAATTLAVPSTNPGAFYNYGLIDFQDGAPDDTLTVIGDFGGEGDITLDVSGLNNTGDLLYIDGSVISSTVQTLDVNLLDLPADGLADVPVVVVAGDSVSGNFVLGDVSYTPIPFVDTSISLVSNINAANTSPDVFNLHVSMQADETGAIAAVLPAGVQLLMNDVVGSWHKRVEGMDERPDKKFSAWVRLYQNKGRVDPDVDGLVGGDFGFEQKNTGGEAGFDFAPNGRFNFGLILGRANADQNLRLGFGSDKIEGNVTGGYGTYRLPKGFYFDISHRRLKFDARLDTANGPMTASGEARTENAESGYSFNIAGFEVETQVQITHTKLAHLDSLTFDSSSYVPPGGRMMRMAAADPAPEFENDADLSSVKRVGVDIRKKYKSKAGTLWEFHWTTNRIRETGGRNDFRVINNLGGTTDIGGDSSLVDVGFTARRGLLLYYGALTWQDGGVLQNFFGAQLGAKYTW